MSHFSFPPGDVTGNAEGEYQHTPHRLEAAVPALSDKSRVPIEATLPAVAEHIEEIAEHFYRHLFAVHPELLDGIFNRGNQATGAQQQALAGSVAAFASALVNTPDHLLEDPLTRVSHKHASLGIQPDHYQVVHDSLMWAIADVLGEAVTPEVAAAWDEVYWLMATGWSSRHFPVNMSRCRSRCRTAPASRASTA
jgi:hemoglobin-like flavoprotein